MAKHTWMVRAGRSGSLLDTFIESGVVGINFDFDRDITDYSSRDEIAAVLQEQNPSLRDRQATTAAGQLYRFAQEIEQQDTVVTYDSSTRKYHVGVVTSSYHFDGKKFEHFPHYRTVSWESEVDRDGLSVRTRNQIGSISTLFLISGSAADEIARFAAGERPTFEPDATGESEPDEEKDLLEDIQARSREFIKDRLSSLDPYEMQDLVAGLLRAMGYKTKVSPMGPDRGKDIIASPDGFGFEQPRIVVEVKHRPNEPTGSSLIRSFLGGRHKDDKGLYVSTGGFRTDARYEAERAAIPLTLMDLDDLVDGVVEQYERLDTETRALIPLSRVYWPG